MVATLSSGPCLVTGGTGFIALHVVTELLEQGDTVHATVRSAKNTKRCQPLLDLQAANPGRLHLFEADLLQEGSFAEAMAGCTVVYHIASPFLIPTQIKDGLKDVVEPALKGTRNVLGAVQRTPSVRRVVLTSSSGAMYGDCADVLTYPNKRLTESCWATNTSPTYGAYHHSKMVSEKAAWEIYEAQAEPKRWKLVVINPGLTIGPPMAAGATTGSLHMIEDLFNGANKWTGCPDVSFPIVDVRDVAAAHVAAGNLSSPNSDEIQGRYILSGADGYTISLLEIAQLVRPFHKRPSDLPRRATSRLITYMAAMPLGLSKKWIDGNIGIKFAVDGRRAVRELGITYRPTVDVVRETYETWEAQQQARV